MRNMILAALLGIVLLGGAAPGNRAEALPAAPAAIGTAATTDLSLIDNVRWRGWHRGGWHRPWGWHRPHFWHRRHVWRWHRWHRRW